MRILLTGDVKNHALAAPLAAGGPVVDQAGTGEETLDLVRHYDYDIVLLDLDLSDMTGYDVLRRMRAGRIGTPVLILSGNSGPEAKVKAFALGADDYMTRPLDRSELLARIQAVVRRSKGHSTASLRVGPLSLNLDSREVAVNDRPVHLTCKEYALLELMMLRKGMVMSKEAFLNHLYGSIDEPEMKIIDVFICKLRKKLAQAGANGLIGTAWGRGYLVRDVRENETMASDLSPTESQLTMA